MWAYSTLLDFWWFPITHNTVERSSIDITVHVCPHKLNCTQAPRVNFHLVNHMVFFSSISQVWHVTSMATQGTQ